MWNTVLWLLGVSLFGALFIWSCPLPELKEPGGAAAEDLDRAPGDPVA